MRISVLFIATICLLGFSSLHVGKEIKVCVDENGKRYFTDSACEGNAKPQDRIAVKTSNPPPVVPRSESGGLAQQPVYDPNQPVHQEWREEPTYHDKNDQLIQEWRQKAYRHLKAERTAPEVSAWRQRTAARNARMAADNEKWLKESRDRGRGRGKYNSSTNKWNSADWAHQYNSKNIEEGGSHKVRVPDVTNIHIHRDRDVPKYYIDPRTGRAYPNVGDGFIDDNGRFIPQ